MLSDFRYDINALRALAVIVVVLFHFNISGFQAGFIGVDIFFVISGFLMTKIIVSQLMENKFSLFNFYLSRSIRIIPALLLVILACAGINYFILPPEEYFDYSDHALSSIFFISNLNYALEANNYFSVATHEIILLHTWSLSTEWQFYIILPIVLWVFSKLLNKKYFYFLLVVLGFIASLLITVFTPDKYAVFAFYNIPTRAWEMLAGGIVYFLFDRIIFNDTKSKVIEKIGYILVLASFFILDSSMKWPSFYTLLPVLGTALVLLANCNSTLLVKNKLVQFFGNISYSFYLWHWPIVFYMNYFHIDQLHYKVLLIGFVILISYLSYKFFEDPIRKNLSKKNKKIAYSIIVLMMLILSVICAYIYKNKGLVDRSSAEYKRISAQMAMPSILNGWCFYDVNHDDVLVSDQAAQCHIGSQATSAKQALLIGDSYAGHVEPFWDTVGKQVGLSINATTSNWCYPSLDKNFTGPLRSDAYQQCQLQRDFIKKHWQSYNIIILGAQWSSVLASSQHRASVQHFLDQLIKEHKTVILMDTPYSYHINIGKEFKRKLFLSQDFNMNDYLEAGYVKDESSTDNILKQMSQQSKNILLLKKQHLYSSTHIARNNIPYALDSGHISVIGSLASADYFMQKPGFIDLKKIINKQH